MVNYKPLNNRRFIMSTKTMNISKALKEIKKNSDSKLEKKVINIILDNKNNDDILCYMKDLSSYGCISGMVGELIYYTDTTKFYKKYKLEIQKMLQELLNNCGFKSPQELFGEKWDSEDIFCQEDQNQNLLAWYAMEEVNNNLLSQLEIE